MNRCVQCSIFFGCLFLLSNSVFAQYDQGPQPGGFTPEPSSAPPTYANLPEPKHVLVVFASNIAVSRDTKDAYVAARGIPPVNKVGIPIFDIADSAFLAQNKEEIRGQNEAGWLYYKNTIATPIKNLSLDTH